MEPNKRIRSKGWFCTWPRCPMSKEAALELLSARFRLVKYVIAEELHADGQPHLHAFLQLASRTEFKPAMFDLEEYHGNYQQHRIAWAKHSSFDFSIEAIVVCPNLEIVS